MSFKVIIDKHLPLKIWGADGIESGAIEQAKEISNLPFVFKHIALMADAHKGKGSTVGSVIPTVGAVIPAAVGVDIGCGMISTRFDCKVDGLTTQDKAELRKRIEKAVPIGRSDNGQRDDIGAWGGSIHSMVPDLIRTMWETLQVSYWDLTNRDSDIAHPRGLGHLGTLGTGNHFIELEYNELSDLCVTIHSGSRGPGARIGGIFMKRAQAIAKQYHLDKYLPNMDLSYFPEGTEEFDKYWRALQWAQQYAWQNREAMMALTIKALEPITGTLSAIDEVHCHHNYARKENHQGRNVIITRKGAIIWSLSGTPRLPRFLSN